MKSPFTKFPPWTAAQFAALEFDEAKAAGRGYEQALDYVVAQLREYNYRVPSRRSLETWTSPRTRQPTDRPRGLSPRHVRSYFNRLRRGGLTYEEAIAQVGHAAGVDARTVKRWLKLTTENPVTSRR